jgi:hypothetical protein
LFELGFDPLLDHLLLECSLIVANGDHLPELFNPYDDNLYDDY